MNQTLAERCLEAIGRIVVEPRGPCPLNLSLLTSREINSLFHWLDAHHAFMSVHAPKVCTPSLTCAEFTASSSGQIQPAVLRSLATVCVHLDTLRLPAALRQADAEMLRDAIRRVSTLRFPQVDDSSMGGLSVIANSIGERLRELDLSGRISVGEEHLLAMANAVPPQMEIVLLNGTRTDASTVRALVQRCGQHLRVLRLHACIRITNKTFSLLGNACPRLHTLDVGLPFRCNVELDVSSMAVASLCGLGAASSLEKVNLAYRGGVDEISVRHLMTRLPRLRQLTLVGSRMLSVPVRERLALLNPQVDVVF